jgi:hypothetical protein
MSRSPLALLAMSRDTIVLVALSSLGIAALVVGACGWVLFARDHRLAKIAAASTEHREASEES